MGFIVILPLGALAAWSIFAIFRWLRRANFGAKWWQTLAILSLVGLGIGVWFAFFLEYNVGNYHLERFPIPAGISVRENPDEPWKKSDIPLAVIVGAQVDDILSGISLCLAPIAVAAFFKENRGKGDFAGPQSS